MFVHPRCSCSRASLEELQTIMERAADRVSAWVLLMRPDGGAEDWDRTPARAAAARIPGTAIATDADGAEAARFGALTSGHVAVFDPEGRLVFSGGITGARGHAGDNTGRQHVLDLVHGRPVAAAEHAVFGCGIHDHDPLASPEEGL